MPTTTDPSLTLRRGGLTFRPATLDDAAFAADVATAVRPDEPEDPASWRHWWASDDPAWTNERWVVLRGETPIGYARHNHAPWEQQSKRYGRVGFELLPAERTPEQLATLLDVMEDRSRASGAKIFATYAREDDDRFATWLIAHGYREERRSKAWVLDLVARRERMESMAADSRAKMREQGIAIRTIDRDGDPEKFHKIHEMSEEAASDVPTTIPHTRQSFEVFVKWFDAPSVRDVVAMHLTARPRCGSTGCGSRARAMTSSASRSCRIRPRAETFGPTGPAPRARCAAAGSRAPSSSKL